MTERLTIFVAIVALGVSFGAPALAASPDRSILIFVEDPRGTLGRELSAELEAMGFAVELRASSSEAPADLETVAREARALAAVKVDESESRIELYIVDVARHQSIRRSIERASVAGTSRSEVAVLRAAELVRVSLIASPPSDQGRDAAPTATKAAAPDRATAPPRGTQLSRRAHFTGGVGPAMLLVRGLRPGLDAALMGGWHGAGSWYPGAYAGVRLPLIPAELATERGAAQVSDVALFASVDVGLAPANSRWFLETGAGATLDWLIVSGEPGAAYSGHRITGYSFSPMLEAGVGVQLTERFVLRTGATLGYALPSTRIVFAGAEVGRWGTPWASVALALSANLR